MRRSWVLALLAAVITTAMSLPANATHPQLAEGEDTSPHAARVVLADPQGAEVGTVLLGYTGSRMIVSVRASGLTPGFHGFHVHAVGQCDGATATPFSSAGGHWNPDGAGHGAHHGDLPPLYADAGGGVATTFTTDAFTLDQIRDADGAALIVHAGPDNLAHVPARYTFTNPDGSTGTGADATTRATGDAGGRFACGVVPAVTPMNHVSILQSRSRTARAVMRSAVGSSAGVVRFAPAPDGRVHVSVDLGGLTQGFHGLHVHAVGRCDGTTATPFSSAGGHLAAGSETHGGHDGDLPPLLSGNAGSIGRARAEFDTDAFTLAQLLDADGSALVVHADRDNLAHIPARYTHTNADGTTGTGPDATTRATGDAGARELCGVVTAPPPPATVALSVDVPVITAGNAPRLTAIVTDSTGAPAPDVPVEFYLSHSVGKLRERITTEFTDETGRAQLVVRPADRTGYSVGVTGPDGMLLPSPVRVVEVHSRVVVASPRSGVVVSSPVTFTGRLSPSYGGRPVGLATYVGTGSARRWVYLAQTTTRADGTFTLTRSLPRGTSPYVLYAPARGENLRGSTALTLTVR